MEAVRAVDVALCVLLRAYLCPDECDPAATSDLHPLFGQALLHEIRRREETHSPSLMQLLQHVQGHVCPGGEEGSAAAAYFVTIKSAVGQHLSGLELPDDLVSLFTSLRDSVINQCTSAPAESEGEGADASSAMGLYLRMCYARYTAMPFEAVCSLLSEVQAYFDAAVAVLQGQPPPYTEPTLKPGPQLELFLNDQLADMGHRIGRLPQADIERPLVKLEAAAPRLPRTHLARHFSSLHHRDSAAALDHLHRFFDRTLHTSQPAAGAATGTGPSNAASAGAGQAEEAAARERGRLQAAALTLGSMHAQLGHMEEALQALNETVRIAQQASDDTCLAHALALLCQVMGACTPGTITSVSQLPGASPAARHHSQLGQLLRRCLRRSEELQLPHLVACSRLSLARFQLLHPHQLPPAAGIDDSSSGAAAAGADGGVGGGSSLPCSSSVAVATALRDTAHLHMATRLAASTPAVPPLASGASSARVLRGVGDLFTSTASLFAPSMAGMQSSAATEVEQLAAGAHLLQAAAWELRGSRQLSQVQALVCLAGAGGVARAEEQCTAFAQLATSVVEAHGYQAAQQVLAAADERFPRGQSKVLAAARLAIAHDRALHRLDLHAAMDLAAQMAALASPTDSTDIALRLEAEERVARTLLAAGRTEEAVQAAHTLFAAAVAAGQALHTARLLLLLARAHQQAGSPLTALPYALTAIDHARQLHADMLAAEAAVLMARLWCDMGAQHAQHAQQELEAALPTILAHGSLELQAAAQTALAEAVMTQHTDADGLRQDAEWVLGLLEESQRLSLQLEDRGAAAHSAYLQALVHDGLGQGALRDAGAASFATLVQPVLA